MNTALIRKLNDGSDRRYRLLLTAVAVLAIWNAYLPTGYDWAGIVSTDVDQSLAAGSWAKRLQWLPLYMIALYVIWRRRALAPALLTRVNLFLLAFTFWATLSVLWSADPGATIRRVVQVWGMILIAFAFCLASWHPDRLVNVVRGAHSALILLSLVFVVALPLYGVHGSGEHAGAWRGVTPHKNHMGQLAAISLLLWVHAWGCRAAPWYRALPWLLLSGLILVMARSSTSLLVAIVAMPLLWLLCRPPVDSEGWLIRTILVLVLVIVLPAHLYWLHYGLPTTADLLGPIAGLFGKDVTLTGRADIWELIGEQIAKHPLQGTGYGAFWLGMEGPSGDIAKKLYFYPGQAHNGYLDIINETGIIGLLLVAGFLITHLIGMQRAGFDHATFAFHLSMLGIMLAWNVTESTLFRTISNWLVISVLSSLAVSRALSPLERGWRRHSVDTPEPERELPRQFSRSTHV